MIDIHAHVLPSIDDGPIDIDESLEVCRRSVEEGVTAIVATPHLFCGIGTDDLTVIRRSAEALRAGLIQAGVDCELSFAGEIRLVEDLLERIRAGQIPFYDSSRRYLLIEPPFAGNTADLLKHTVFQLRLRGMTPIIAHPERIRMFFDQPGLIEQMAVQGALPQVNASSLLSGDQSGPVWEWVRRGFVRVVAGDMHGRARPANMRAAFEAVTVNCGVDTARCLFEENPARILRGESLPEI